MNRSCKRTACCGVQCWLDSAQAAGIHKHKAAFPLCRCSLVEESSSARLGEEEAPQAALSKQSQREHVASSVRNYKQQLAAQHRQHATGVSYLTDVPGRAEPVPAAQGSTHFAKFADAHLPPGGSSHAPSHTGRGPDPFTSGAEDRVRPCYRPAGPPASTRMHPPLPSKNCRPVVTMRVSMICSPVQAWSLGTFEKKVPSGRQDVLELQLWLRDQMLALKSTSQGTGDQSADLFAYAEKTLDLYNMAFHELTRQVRLAAPFHAGSVRCHFGSSVGSCVMITCELEGKKP